MKKKWLGEIALLILPLVVIGGVARWKGHIRVVDATSSLDTKDLWSGPPRLEATNFTFKRPNECEVFEGFDHVINVTLWQKGISPMSPDWPSPVAHDITEKLRLVYRRGQKWNSIAKVEGNESQIRETELERNDFGNFAFKRRIALQVRLDKVPADAEEIRLRGNFIKLNGQKGVDGYCGSIPLNLRKPGLLYYEARTAFDIPLQKPKEIQLKSVALHRTQLEFVGASWFDTNGSNWLMLRLRDNSGRHDNAAWGNLRAFSYSLQDGSGHEIELTSYAFAGKPVRLIQLRPISRDRLGWNWPANECVVPFVPFEIYPRRGWDNIHGPLKLKVKLSDGNSWPLEVIAIVRREEGDFRSLLVR